LPFISGEKQQVTQISEFPLALTDEDLVGIIPLFPLILKEEHWRMVHEFLRCDGHNLAPGISILDSFPEGNGSFGRLARHPRKNMRLEASLGDTSEFEN
jgi:hypothetical protein